MAISNGESTSPVCPMCDLEVPLSGDEKIGEQLICPYCQVPLSLRKRRGDELYFEEDF